MTYDDDEDKKNIKKIEPLKSVAVALKHNLEDEDVPKVVASGRGYIAEQIIALAFENGVKVREDADLAEILSAIDIDTAIPVEAFAAVAEILSYVYQANNAGAKSYEESN
ncbi:MAG: EscU/YscU/HrcU family type III secretion system export apparatus switch protein [Alphaproteobacteria bacterium]